MIDMTVGNPPPGCTCGPYWSVIPPGPCPHHSQWWTVQPYAPLPPFPPPPLGSTLTDEDVERIARRVADLLKPQPRRPDLFDAPTPQGKGDDE